MKTECVPGGSPGHVEILQAPTVEFNWATKTDRLRFTCYLLAKMKLTINRCSRLAEDG